MLKFAIKNEYYGGKTVLQFLHAYMRRTLPALPPLIFPQNPFWETVIPEGEDDAFIILKTPEQEQGERQKEGES